VDGDGREIRENERDDVLGIVNGTGAKDKRGPVFHLGWLRGLAKDVFDLAEDAAIVVFIVALFRLDLLLGQGRRELFEQLCEAYYNPMCRVGRAIKRMAGKNAAGPPIFRGAADSYVGDYVILPLGAGGLRWPPSTLIAVCKT